MCVCVPDFHVLFSAGSTEGIEKSEQQKAKEKKTPILCRGGKVGLEFVHTLGISRREDAIRYLLC